MLEKKVNRPSKKRTFKKTEPKKNFKTREDINVERALIDNFIGLQKVMTNLSVKFETLSDNISKLLNLFELSAKAVAEKEVVSEKDKKDNAQILEKINEMIEQNKIIAQGVAMIHEKENEIYSAENSQEEQMDVPRPTPVQIPQNQIPRRQFPPIQRSTQQIPESGLNLQGYQRSIKQETE